MGNPDWSKIPYEKMPQWKKDELIKMNKAIVATLEDVVEEAKEEVNNFRCEVCERIFKNVQGLNIHKSKHN